MPIGPTAAQPSLSLSAREARALALRAQGFGANGWSLRRPFQVLRHLGAIQLDSVNVLARSHELIPFARLGAYDPADLHRAIYAERGGFEYWGHEASWLPMAEYRAFLPRMLQRRATPRGWWTRIREEHAALYPRVLDRVRAEGPLGASAFDDPRAQRGTWWDWKPAKLVLEDLFDQGLVMCSSRTATFARLYDIPERVLPAWVDTTDPGPEAAARHLLLRGIRGLGIGTPFEAADYFRLKPAAWRPALDTLLASGEVLRVSVEGWKTPGLLAADALERYPLRVPRHRPTFLSPFDNLVWERGRTERLFGFRYRVEIYVPEPLRTYGYYVLPLLARGRLGGRADLKLDRPTSTLRVRGLWLEGAEPHEAATALTDLARHLGATDIALERADEAPVIGAALGDVGSGTSAG